MLSTLLACLLLWVLYLWLDRRRLLRLVNPPKSAFKPKRIPTPKPAPSLKFPSKPRFINSQPISELNRARRRAKQVPPDAPKRSSQPTIPIQPIPIQPVEPLQEASPPPKIEPVTPAKPQAEINFDAIAREAARKKSELCRVSSKTQYELYRLTHGDTKMIERLVKHSRSRNPDRPEQWIWEKVIRDLERDRGYR